MTIKAFKSGQTVFVMRNGDIRSQTGKRNIIEATVVNVGRKYVTIDKNRKTQFKETADRRPYLIEHTKYGASDFLFPSKEAVDEYCEREELKNWVRMAAGWDKIDRYTIEQLRAVKKILEENSNG